VLGGHVHGDVAQQARIGLVAFYLYQNTDRAVVMAIIAKQSGKAAEPLRLDVLTNEADNVADAFINGLLWIVHEWLGEEFRHGSGILDRDLLCHVAGELDEMLALGDRGAFAAHFDYGADLLRGIDENRDAALRGLTAGLVHLEFGKLLTQKTD